MLVERMHTLHLNCDNASLPIMRLLTTMCCPGNVPNRAMQHMLAQALLCNDYKIKSQNQT